MMKFLTLIYLLILIFLHVVISAKIRPPFLVSKYEQNNDQNYDDLNQNDYNDM
jgi:hypothetical protein